MGYGEHHHRHRHDQSYPHRLPEELHVDVLAVKKSCQLTQLIPSSRVKVASIPML